jgi:uncharacterized membrane protein YGL010W
MAAKKSADQWFAEYGESHQDDTNETIHWICVPLIFFSVMGFIWIIPVPDNLLDRAPWFNWTLPVIAGVMVFYLRLSPMLSAGLLFFISLCYSVLAMLELIDPTLIGKLCAALFVLAWIGQLIGHRIEGQKPSFFHDLVFLLIGPAWLMAKIYKKLGQPY